MSRRPVLRTILTASVAAVALLATACASPGADAEDDGYVTPGKLTVATGEIAYYPYVIDDDFTPRPVQGARGQTVLKTAWETSAGPYALP